MDDAAKIKLLTKTLDSVAQNAHMLSGAFVVLTMALFRLDAWMPTAILFYVTLTAWKEFYWDEIHEIDEVRGSSAKDFLFYQIGWIGAIVLYFISDAI
jgi:hypothetical protein